MLPAVREQNYTLTEVEKVGTWIARSGMFGCTKPEQGQVIAIACREKGMNLFEFLDRYHVLFDGKIKLKSHAVHAEFRKAGGKVKWIKTGDDGKIAEAEFTFEGQTTRLSYTIEQATIQGLVKKDSAWTKTPDAMLRARLMTKGVAMLCPEIYLSGGDDDAPQPAPLKLADPHVEKEASGAVEIITYDPADANRAMAEAVGAVLEKASAPTPPPAIEVETVAYKPTVPAEIPDDSNPELMPVPKPTATVLPDDLLTKLAVVLADVGEEASVAFCRSINWLKEGETMANLSLGNARYIIGKHKAFAEKAKAFATKA